jgi:ATP-dependent Clp protease protease subunit
MNFQNFVYKNTRRNSEEEHDHEERGNVENSSNNLYFYSPVLSNSVIKLNKGISSLSNNLVEVATNLDIPVPPIKLHINSGGGSLFDGLAAVDTIRKSKAPVHTIIEGGAASAATLMSVVGAKRYIHKHSFMLIHQLSGGMWGKFAEMQDEIQNSQLLMETIQNIYLKHTKMSKKTLKDLLKRDIWLDAKTCKEYGLVDEVIE